MYGVDAGQPRPSHWSDRLGGWRVLQLRDFRLLWLGQGIALLGEQCFLVVLPWLTLQLSGSGLTLGAVLTAASIPRAAFMVLGGALADRVAPRSLLLAERYFAAFQRWP